MNVLIAVDDTPESRHAVDTAYRFFGPDVDYSVLSVGDRAPVFVGGYGAGAMPTPADLTVQLEAAQRAAEHAARERVAAAAARAARDGLDGMDAVLASLADEEEARERTSFGASLDRAMCPEPTPVAEPITVLDDAWGQEDDAEARVRGLFARTEPAVTIPEPAQLMPEGGWALDDDVFAVVVEEPEVTTRDLDGLGLPDAVMARLRRSTHVDLTAALADAVAPWCLGVPEDAPLFVGPRAEELLDPVFGDVRAVAMAVSGPDGNVAVAARRDGRALHLVVGDAGWSPLISLRPDAVAWVDEQDTIVALATAVDADAPLSFGPVGGALVSVTAADVAATIMELLDRAEA